MSITKHESTELALDDQQTGFTPKQTAALAHIGVEHAGEGDLEVFFHVCKRSGLDPFARQIYMISRQVSEKDRKTGEWVKVTKQTIQTGIDGFRLIGRRAADRARHTVSVEAPEWARDDGTWRPVWSNGWGLPVAARVTIRRDGEPFTAIALFDEYKQTKYGGDLTAMWAQRPAGQLAKCAEALAWRMAFPQDLSGIYADEEMAQADNPPPAPAQQPRRGGLAAVLPDATDPSPAPDAATSEPPTSDLPVEVEASAGEAPDEAMLDFRSKLARKMFAVLADAGLGGDSEEQKTTRLAEVSAIIGRTITTSKEMTVGDARAVINTLEVRDGNGEDPVDAELVEDGAEA